MTPDSGILDIIAAAFAAASRAGFSTLSALGIPLLGTLAVIAYYSEWSQKILQGTPSIGDALGGTLWLVVRIALYLFFTRVAYDLGIAAFETFANWGALAGGPGFSGADFLAPSRIMDIGIAQARPILEYMQRFSAWGVLSGALTFLIFFAAWLVTVAAFIALSLQILMTLIEFHLSLMVAGVLIPWGVLSQTRFLAEYSFSTIIGALVRVLLTVAIMAIFQVVYVQVGLRLTPGGDPTIYSAIAMAVAAIALAIVAWKVANRAANTGGRGMALALTGAAFLPHGYVGTTLASMAIRGGVRAMTSR